MVEVERFFGGRKRTVESSFHERCPVIAKKKVTASIVLREKREDGNCGEIGVKKNVNGRS